MNIPELILVERFFADVVEDGLKRYKLSMRNKEPKYLYIPKEQLEEWELDSIDVFSDASFDYNVCFIHNSLGNQ